MLGYLLGSLRAPVPAKPIEPIKPISRPIEPELRRIHRDYVHIVRQMEADLPPVSYSADQIDFQSGSFVVQLCEQMEAFANHWQESSPDGGFWYGESIDRDKLDELCDDITHGIVDTLDKFGRIVKYQIRPIHRSFETKLMADFDRYMGVSLSALGTSDKAQQRELTAKMSRFFAKEGWTLKSEIGKLRRTLRPVLKKTLKLHGNLRALEKMAVQIVEAHKAGHLHRMERPHMAEVNIRPHNDAVKAISQLLSEGHIDTLLSSLDFIEVKIVEFQATASDASRQQSDIERRLRDKLDSCEWEQYELAEEMAQKEE